VACPGICSSESVSVAHLNIARSPDHYVLSISINFIGDAAGANAVPMQVVWNITSVEHCSQVLIFRVSGVERHRREEGGGECEIVGELPATAALGII
jgi:hypothetical protein